MIARVSKSWKLQLRKFDTFLQIKKIKSLTWILWKIDSRRFSTRAWLEFADKTWRVNNLIYGIFKLNKKIIQHCIFDFRNESTLIVCKTGKMVPSKTHYTTSELSSMYPSLVAAAYVSVRIDSSHKVSSQMFAYVNDSTITAIQPKTSIVRFVMKYLRSSIMTKQGAGLISPSASGFLQLNEVSIIDCGQKISH